ncbi:hypothetical protein CA13_01650 [Planctomycetes bacterium CA13]|uniref:Uncharacterized protein n=1 Tax=Novipirellula herctigrandis TaxID=2527986 RepID=A0A5C5YUT6_9BACT|nr:hypothetical protein CA13_01650 [Planctomycetes bacterium CA13]
MITGPGTYDTTHQMLVLWNPIMSGLSRSIVDSDPAEIQRRWRLAREPIVPMGQLGCVPNSNNTLIVCLASVLFFPMAVSNVIAVTEMPLGLVSS